MTLKEGRELGPFKIIGLLGVGGMGEVYRAQDTRLGRVVAIKILPEHLSKPGSIHRFEREARAISSLNHPNICQLYDVGHHAGISYLVMECLKGESVGSALMRSSALCYILPQIGA